MHLHFHHRLPLTQEIREGNLLKRPLASYIVSLASSIEFSAVYLYGDVELIFNCTDNNPGTDNIASSCSSTLNRSSISYDLTFSLHLDETFTPAVISAINHLRAASFQVNSNGDVIAAGVTVRHIPLDSNVIQGPVTIEVSYDNFTQRLNGIGHSLAVCICNA